ncbi:MAG: hypothetical protein ACOY0R_21245 [Chloroflexota bacterium]
MSSQETPAHTSPLPCTWQHLSNCQDCQADGKLMCHFDKKDMLHFFMIIFPFGVTAIAGTIHAGYGPYLWLWLVYAIFFFFVWEARVLCRHCPYWAEESNVLHCHANYGVVKIWKYQPGPMSKSEKIQFIIGALLLIGFPFPFLVLGQEYLLVLIGLSAVVSGTFILRRNVCNRCINFSCPMNAVPKETMNAFFARNPVIQKAWESKE